MKKILRRLVVEEKGELWESHIYDMVQDFYDENAKDVMILEFVTLSHLI